MVCELDGDEGCVYEVRRRESRDGSRTIKTLSNLCSLSSFELITSAGFSDVTSKQKLVSNFSSSKHYESTN